VDSCRQWLKFFYGEQWSDLDTNQQLTPVRFQLAPIIMLWNIAIPSDKVLELLVLLADVKNGLNLMF
jgi:hypothetical protein